MIYKALPVIVTAHKIVDVGEKTRQLEMHLALENGENFTATPEMLSRMTPVAGDYVVTQADGYTYLNPREVFERKYARAPEGTAEEAPKESRHIVVSPYRFQCVVEDTIEAAHQLNLPYESKCNRLHGHTYRFRVIVVSPKLDANKMVVDFSVIKEVLRGFDHMNLNDFFQPSTAENFAAYLLDALQEPIWHANRHAQVFEVGVGETASTWVTVQWGKQ